MIDGRHLDVSAWEGLELLEPFSGGARTAAHLARRGDERFVVRRSTRPEAALAWELEMTAHLSAEGIRVPSTVPTDDGRRHGRGVLVQRFLPGVPPASGDDWRRVRSALDRPHHATEAWPQRPGFASAAELMTQARGGDVALDTMPEDAVALLRDCWRPLVGGQTCVVHADIGAGNLLIDDGTVALLDWDEARVDVPGFDLGNLPAEAVGPTPVSIHLLHHAALAWEVATCWVIEPDYAVRRLVDLRRLVA